MRGEQIHICIIGGGFTGTAAAISCLKQLRQPFRLSVIEPNAVLGRGVAYGGHQPLHLLNVRTRDLTIHAERPRDFLNWAFQEIDQGENDVNLLEGLAHAFLPRQLFGEYVRQRLSESIAIRSDVDFDIVNDSALSLSRVNGQFVVHTAGTGFIAADVVILATAYGQQDSYTTGALAPYESAPRERAGKAKSIVLIGSGLTMVDTLLAARRDGFSGTVTIISRHGQLPRCHAAQGVVSQDVALPKSKHLSRLTSAVRIACEAAEAHGTPWQAIINGLRPKIQDIWQRLPVEEQARFLRHVRRYWDAYRHRLPNEVHARMQAELDAGNAVLAKGKVINVVRDSSGFMLTWKRRGAAVPEQLRTDLAFDCSGYRPDLGSPLICSLIDQGLARSDAHNLGLEVKRNGQVLNPDSKQTFGLFALGPLCQGSLWEITAVPEIVQQAHDAASAIAALQTSRFQAALPKAC